LLLLLFQLCVNWRCFCFGLMLCFFLSLNR
jgi:hypothetical protein